LVSLDPDIRPDLEWLRDDYAGLVATATPADLAAASRGPRWTNAELLFHMWFGQHIARVFIPVFGRFSRLPAGASSLWPRVLTVFTRSTTGSTTPAASPEHEPPGWNERGDG
jgi:hypothetical protein